MEIQQQDGKYEKPEEPKLDDIPLELRTSILAQKNEEYRVLRQEVIAYIGSIRTILTVAASLIVGEIAAGVAIYKLNQSASTSAAYLLLSVPLTMLLMGIFTSLCALYMHNIANYIREQVEIPIEQLLGKDYRNWLTTIGSKIDQNHNYKVMGWEQWNEKHSLTSGGWMLLTVLTVIILVLVISGIGLYFGIQGGWDLSNTINAAVFLIALPIVLAGFLYKKVRKKFSRLLTN